MDEEVGQLVGERSRPSPERTANRWGSERGYCVVMGQKVPVERPRVRSTDDREIRLGTYGCSHRGEPLTETVWEKLMLGLTTPEITVKPCASSPKLTGWRRAR